MLLLATASNQVVHAVSAVSSWPPLRIDSLPQIDIRDSDWSKWAAVASALAALGTIFLAVVTTQLAFYTLRAAKATERAVRSDSVRSIRAAEPIVVAMVTTEALSLKLSIKNAGAVARFVNVSAICKGREFPPASYAIQVLGTGEESKDDFIRVGYAPNEPMPMFQKVRIRYQDVYGYRYMTEYGSIHLQRAYPTFRKPWIDTASPSPPLSSAYVSWEVEHYERIIGEPSETIDPNTKYRLTNFDAGIPSEVVEPDKLF